MKRLFALLAAFLLACSAGAFAVAEDDDDDPVFNYLPVDFSPGMPLDRSKFTPDSYVDPSISVKITTGDQNGVLYWIADIEIDHPSQLRTAAADSFDKTTCM